MKYANFDISKLPFVYININPVVPPVEEFKKDYLNVQEKLVNENTGMIWIVNAKHLKLVPSEHRIAAGEFVKRNEAKMKSNVRVSFLVEASFWTQMMLNSIALIVKSPIPTHFCANLAEVAEILKKEYNITLPQAT